MAIRIFFEEGGGAPDEFATTDFIGRMHVRAARSGIVFMACCCSGVGGVELA